MEVVCQFCKRKERLMKLLIIVQEECLHCLLSMIADPLLRSCVCHDCAGGKKRESDYGWKDQVDMLDTHMVKRLCDGRRVRSDSDNYKNLSTSIT